MACQKCKSDKILSVSGKCSDMCHVTFKGVDVPTDGAPRDVGLGGGDYLSFTMCMDCGQVQNTFPIEVPAEWYAEDYKYEEIV